MTNDAVGKAGLWSPSKPDARRTLILCAAGALIGLALAGFGLFTARGTRTSVVPAEDVAMVNGVPILISDYLLQLRALYDVSLSGATQEQKKKVLDDMIREELYVQRGIELGMQTDTIEVRTALVGAVEQQATADATMAQPSESELLAFYDENVAKYASEGAMVLIDYIAPAETAAAAVADLRAGGGDQAIARRGLRRTAALADGEEFYFAARIHLGDVLFETAKALRDGAVSDPVALPDGVHILVMKRNIAPVPQRYEDIRDKVLADYIARQAKILTAGNERFLRKRADVLVAPGFE
jgi:parvulin-like peptidyl-prolyl isomerase